MNHPPLSDVFTIFFLTLGPIKTIPAFFILAGEATPQFRSKTALQTTFIATGICLFIALIGHNVIGKWNVSLDALKLTGGLILLLSALKIITMQSQATGGKKATAETPLKESTRLALSPLTIPVVITSYGVVAILFYMVIAKGDFVFQAQVIGILLLMMFLNYLGMIFSDEIMNVVGLPILRLIGWVFAVMQSTLAIDIMLRAFKSLGIIHNIP